MDFNSYLCAQIKKVLLTYRIANSKNPKAQNSNSYCVGCWFVYGFERLAMLLGLQERQLTFSLLLKRFRQAEQERLKQL